MMCSQMSQQAPVQALLQPTPTPPCSASAAAAVPTASIGANPKQEPGPNQCPFLLIRAQPLSCNTSASAASASATATAAAAAAGSAAAAALRMDPQPAPEPNACPTAYCAATSANPAVPLLLLHSQVLLPVHHPATVWTIAQGARSPINASRKPQLLVLWCMVLGLVSCTG